MLAGVLERYLSAAGHRVEIAADGADALASWQQEAPDVVLLDVMLPTLSGRLWDTSAILPDSGSVGGLISALTGYRARPNLTDVLVYALYWGLVLWFLFWSRPKIDMARS